MNRGVIAWGDGDKGVGDMSGDGNGWKWSWKSRSIGGIFGRRWSKEMRNEGKHKKRKKRVSRAGMVGEVEDEGDKTLGNGHTTRFEEDVR